MLTKLLSLLFITTTASFRTTTIGCACKETWTSDSFSITPSVTVNNYCGNPDNDLNGDWCEVECRNCGTNGWGTCAPAGTRDSSTSTCTAPSVGATSCDPSACSSVVVNGIQFGCCCSGSHAGLYCQECAAGNCDIRNAPPSATPTSTAASPTPVIASLPPPVSSPPPAVSSPPPAGSSCQAPVGSFCCDDDPTNPNYVCSAGTSCGRGICVPAGSALCGCSGQRFCAAGTTCCGTTCCSTTSFCGGDEDSCSCSSEAFPQPRDDLQCGATAVSNCEEVEDPCFPSDAKVTLSNGTIVRIASLQEGDSMLAATVDGVLSSDTATLLSISQPKATAPFVSLSTANSTLRLTAEHHLPVGPICCNILKKAKDVAVGDIVWTAQTKGITSAIVTKKFITNGVGLHSPVLINGGFPIVDGFVTSFDSIEKVSLAKKALSYVVDTCRATGTCELFRNLLFGSDEKYIVPKLL